jgi:putative ABC transport system permease protein
MLGLSSKVTTFQVQRNINRYAQEPLMAILPGVAVSELWQMMSWIENTLLLVSVLVFIAGCLGVSAMLLSSIRERGKEIQLLRVIGASPSFLFLLIQLEAFFMTLFSLITASALLLVSLLLAKDYLVTHFGLHISVNIFSISSVYLMAGIVITSIVVAMIPSFIGYKQSNSKNTTY